jgi:hypothetical protein
MPGKTIIVFLEYIEVESWCGREILSGGTTLWAGHNILQTLGTDGHNWDEIFIVEFSDRNIYNIAQESLAEEKKIKNYKIILINPYPKAQMDKMNEMLRGFVNSTIDTTPGLDIREAMTETHLDFRRESIELMRQRDKKLPFVMVVFNKFRDIPMYPDNYKGEIKTTGREAYKLYGRAVVQYQGKFGAQMPFAGNVSFTVVGDEDWDDFVLIRYRSNVEFEKTFTPKFIQGISELHRHASLESTKGYAATPREEFL